MFSQHWATATGNVHETFGEVRFMWYYVAPPPLPILKLLSLLSGLIRLWFSFDVRTVLYKFATELNWVTTTVLQSKKSNSKIIYNIFIWLNPEQQSI